MQKSTAVVGMLIVGALGFFLGTLTKGGLGVSPTDGKGGAGEGSVVAGAVDPSTNIFNVPLGASAVKGPATAKVTIIEFSDFQCPFCTRVLPTLDALMKEFPADIRLAFKHNPLPMHPEAPLAAAAAVAAQNQGKFWEMHDKLFANQKALKREDLMRYATTLGLDIAKFTKDLDDPATKARVDADMKLAASIGARGTPNFFVNGEQLSGAQPIEKFRAAVTAAIARADKLLAAGVKPEMLYAELIKNGRTTPAPAAPRPGAPDPNAVYKVDAGDSPAKGGAEPKVTIIEFSDFQCPFCSRVGETIATVMKTYGDDVRIVWKNMPLPMHPDAPLAAEAAFAAGAQGKFWEFHDKLFANQKALKREDLIRYAGELGLNVATFTTAIDTHAYKARVDADMALASKFGVTGTPKFFVNGRVLGGAVPFDQFKAIIDVELKKADALLAAGTPRGGLYAKLIEKGLTSAAAAPPAGDKPARPTVDPKAIHKVTATGPSWGPADAPITIVEFSDFECPFCSKVEADAITKIKEAYPGKIRVVWKNLPLPFHKNAHLAAEAALEAGAQGKFWEYHAKLFANQKALDRPSLEKYATEIGLNMAKFTAALDAGTHKAAVDADAAYGNTMGAQGTPAFFINGRFVSGARPFEMFKPVIDEELVRADALLAKGTPKAKLYESLVASGSDKAVWITPPPGAPGAGAGPGAVDTTVYNIDLGSAPFHGPKFAPITIVEFSDFQCPFCSKLGPVVKELEAEYAGKVKVAFKHFPLSFHKDAFLAAEAAAIAGAAGKFWEYHDVLFANQTALGRDALIKYAGDVGLNVAKFTADLDGHKYKALVEADMAEGTKVGVTGTPTSYINGRKTVGANKAAMKALIDAALAAPAGKPAEAPLKGAAPALKTAPLPAKPLAAPAPKPAAPPAK